MCISGRESAWGRVGWVDLGERILVGGRVVGWGCVGVCVCGWGCVCVCVLSVCVLCVCVCFRIRVCRCGGSRLWRSGCLPYDGSVSGSVFVRPLVSRIYIIRFLCRASRLFHTIAYHSN